MMKQKIAAVVIWYNPDFGMLENINTYSSGIDRIIIVDNSENPDAALHKAISDNLNVEIIADRKNHGIAKALNLACAIAARDGFEWLLTMDQDSGFTGDNLSLYLQDFQKCPVLGSVAIAGIRYDPKFLRDKITQDGWTEVDSLITSGSLVNLGLWKRSGGFEEKLFIDEVDHEYCFRLKTAGYKIICFTTPMLSHNLGIKKQIGKAGSSPVKQKTLHSPIRLYYMVRNGLYIYKEYGRLYASAAKRTKIIFVSIKNNILYGEQRFTTARYAILGWWHYVKNRYYKL